MGIADVLRRSCVGRMPRSDEAVVWLRRAGTRVRANEGSRISKDDVR